ncbi:MAG: aldose epimerase family protein [Planktomarina sp.]
MIVESFGHIETGAEVHRITIGTSDLTVKVLTLGAILNDVRLKGVDWPLTLGATAVDGYRGPLRSFGSFMGPVINRIKGCTAQIDGQDFTFEKHHSGNHTQHSGSTGFQNQVWELAEHGDTYAVLTLQVPDMMGGFPGNRTTKVRYDVEGASLHLTATATTDAVTLMNPANHSYWALDPDIGFAGHKLTVWADTYSEPGDSLMPTGQILPVDGSPYDFRQGQVLAGGSDQFFDLNLCSAKERQPLRKVARLKGTSGVFMDMATTECGLQVYDCGTINAPGFPTHHGAAYGPYAGVALEAQSWPGATTHEHFPSILLNPEDTYTQVTQWSFGRT